MAKTTAKSNFGIEQDKEVLVNPPEVSVFIDCLVMANQLRGLERAFKKAEIDRDTFRDESSAVLERFNEAAAATERFDIVMPVFDFGQFSPFFWRWFNWWNDYFKSLTPRQIGDIKRLARERVASVNDRRPADHWVRYRHTPAFTLVLT